MEPDNQMSALEHNIKTKGENSYYYAHGRKYEMGESQGKTIQGPGIITGGDPVLLEKKSSEITVIKNSRIFEKYAFYDDDKFVQIKIDLSLYFKDLTIITEQCIESNFEEKGFTIKVTEPNGEPIYMVNKKLFKKIVPDECKIKIVKNSLKISLKKKDGDEEWEKLNA